MAKGEFARRLALLRGLRGWTQEELAERLGVTRETVVRWESGRNAATRNKLIGICDVLGVTEAEFWDPHYPTEYADPDGPIEVVEPEPSPYHNVRVDDRYRALECPRCGSREHLSDEHARYCGDCGCPVYNLCTVDKDHINKPTFRRCGRCGAQTWWSLSEERFVDLLGRLAIGSVHNNEEA